MRRPLLFLLLPPLLLRLCEARGRPPLSKGPLKKLEMSRWPLLDDGMPVAPAMPRLLRSATKSASEVNLPLACPAEAFCFLCWVFCLKLLLGTCELQLEWSNTAVRGSSGCECTIIEATGLLERHDSKATSLFADSGSTESFGGGKFLDDGAFSGRSGALPTGNSSE